MRTARLLLLGLLVAARGAAAEWEPQWSGVWQREPGNSGFRGVGLHAAPDGGAFAGIRYNRSNRAHVALSRFGSDGALSWVQAPDEGGVIDFHGFERLRSGRLAAVGVPRSGAQVFVRVHDADSGDLLWQRESAAGQLFFEPVRHGLHVLAENAQGELFVPLSDPTSGDYVVLRYAADGTPLATWRWHAGPHVRATDIVALDDGGAAVTGVGTGLAGGYATVRFDADGDVRFDDLEPGDHGSPLGPAYMAADADGSLLLAGTPEDGAVGVPEATAWKLAPDGARLWTRVLGVGPGFSLGRDLLRFQRAVDGDALLVIDGPGVGVHSLVRLDGASGAVRWETPLPLDEGDTTYLPTLSRAESAQGRLLLAGNFKRDNVTHVARLVELEADGTLCRRRDDDALSSADIAVAGEQGWTVLGLGSLPGDGVHVQRFDDDGACTEGVPDALFADGFEAGATR